MKVLLVIPTLNFADITPRMQEWLYNQPYKYALAPEKGYGFACKQCMLNNPGYDVYVLLDSDLAMNPKHVKEMIDYIACGWDVVVGSRQTKAATVKRTWLRGKVSKIYNTWCSLLFDSELTEHLCGFRAYSGRVVREVFPLTTEAHWIWQCETVVLPQILGYAVTEIPIEWIEYRYTKTPMKRLFKDSYQMGIRTFKLWCRWRRYAQ
jgi:glycosyltransferase involved in cell wall biosynthesis